MVPESVLFLSSREQVLGGHAGEILANAGLPIVLTTVASIQSEGSSATIMFSTYTTSRR